MKLQEHATAIATVTTQNRCTTSALTAAEHQRTRTKAIENPRSRQTLELSMKDLPKATSEVELRTEVMGEAEAQNTPRPMYYMYHRNETDHRTKDCPIYIDTKRKMNQGITQPSPQLQSREVNHTM
jgi:hypothetical protein